MGEVTSARGSKTKGAQKMRVEGNAKEAHNM
jgi:hypothetical protein